MKKIFFLLIALLASLMTYAYDVTNFFTAYSADGKYYLLDSVKIDNVTQGWSQTIDCSADTSVNYSVLPNNPMGIDDVMASSSDNGLISDYRNYLSSHRFAVNVDRAGLLSIRAIDMLGRTIVSHDEYCEEGSYHFQMSLSQTQPFILSVTTANNSATMMLLNTSNVGNNTITCENINPIRRAPLQQESAYELCEGDEINYTGYSHRQGQVIVSQVVTIYLRLTDELIFFIFQSAVHSNEGSYVGLIGFNNQLYSKQIGLLTGSNLSQYTSFIDNLSTANGTILAHAVNGALDSLDLAPIPTKLNDVTLVTFTDGLDVGSWRMNKDYSSSAQYLQAVSNRIGKTYIDGSLLTSYAIGIKGSDVTDEERFDNDLKNLASDPSYVFNVKDMTEVRRKFRDIAAKIYHTYISYSLLLSLPAPDPDSRIRLTFDNISDAGQSEYYLEGTYSFSDYGVLNNVSYCGVRCANGSTLISYPDGMFDIFVLHNLETNLGERIVASNVKQWYYIPSSGKWQINSEFTPASGVTVTEDRNSAIIMLVLDCSSSLSSNFSSIKSYAKEFLNVLAGKTTFSKPSVSANAPILGKLSATCGGKITDDKGMSILEKGICFSENGNMDNAVYYPAGSGSDEFDVVVDGLEEGKTYYYHAYARNEVGTAYSTRQQLVAIDYHLPTVNTTSASSNYYTTATASGKILSDGNQTVTERGICYSLVENPTIDDDKVVKGSGLGTFTCNLSGLTGGTTYYLRAYAINSVGVAYGEEMSVRTRDYEIPTVQTLSADNISYTTATLYGNVTANGGQNVTERGFCYSTSEKPTIDNNKYISGNGLGKFSGNIENFTDGTKYYIRAYAVNSVGIGYGDTLSFKTIDALPPTISTDSIINITCSTAKCFGTITATNGDAIKDCGFCYSQNPYPTVENGIVVQSNSTDVIITDLINLDVATIYFVRAYATNKKGTSYGEELKFRTLPPEGALVGTFSVSETKKIRFSQGNLQYQASTNTWRFAESQLMICGFSNTKASSTYSGWIDMFGWGTSGYNDKQPYMTSTTSSDYGDGDNDIANTNYDWGVYNAISNGGNQAGLFRTLTYEEAYYLYNTRENAKKLRGKAKVNGRFGYMLLPDNWEKPDGVVWNSNAEWDDSNANVYSTSEWEIMEESGAVFLPCCGYKMTDYENNLAYTQYSGNYWLATCYSSTKAYTLYFYLNAASISPMTRMLGGPVRLVQDVK